MKHVSILRNINIDSIKTILIVLTGMLLATMAVSAGNISPGVSNEATTEVTATATLTLPAEGIKYDATVPVEYTITGDVHFELDGIDITAPVSGKYIILPERLHNLSIVNSNNGVVLAMVNFSVDTTAPKDVTNITASSITDSSITWNWTNPGDSDLANIIINVTKTSDGTVIVPYTRIGIVTSYEVTGLDASTEYRIIVKTEDDAV